MLPITALTRATNAAMALADNMHVIGKQATGSPREALGALDHCRQIVPSAPAWDAVALELDSLYSTLSGYQEFVPAADGSDIGGWIDIARDTLEPFSAGLFDERLAQMVAGLAQAHNLWSQYDSAVLQGSRADALLLLEHMTEALGPISPSLVGWLGALRSWPAERGGTSGPAGAGGRTGRLRAQRRPPPARSGADHTRVAGARRDARCAPHAAGADCGGAALHAG
jgi:hypothetical protein